MAAEFQQHPFWDYSLALYAKPGVQDACLTLQDEFGLDVNLILFCIWAGGAGPGRLSIDELQESVSRAGLWQTKVVEPVRLIRRALKSTEYGATPDLVSTFRPRVQKVELHAEHVEQLLLAGIVPVERGETGRQIAEENLRAYLGLRFIEPESAAQNHVALIVERAF